NLFLEDVKRKNPTRVPGTAVFMTVSPFGTPLPLLHHLKHNHVLHEKVVLLSIQSADVPTVSEEDRVKLEDLGQEFYRVVATYGFMQSPNVPETMRLAAVLGLETEPFTTTYFLGRETLVTTGDSKMMRWRKNLFAFMSRNSQAATTYFSIPLDRVVELGVQVEL
ncbi:MAG: KUP/HAK/KT family potassium transporter, partial [Acidobacteriota bacterium]